MNLRIFKVFSWLLPGRYKEHMKKLSVYAGKEWDSDEYLGLVTLVSLFVFLVMLEYSFFVGFELVTFIFSFVLFAVIQIGFYFILYFKMMKRTERVEKYLPDVLQLLSSNIRAGMTPFQAMKFSARDEFGELKKEIEYATTKALGTGSFAEALSRIRERINSPVLERAIQLFVSSMKSGAHMSKILEDVSRDIAETRSLKKELISNTKTYTMFIMFVVLLGAPILLIISIRFLEMITEMQAKTSNVGFGLNFLMGEVSITPEFMVITSVLLLVITSLSASMLMGVIKDGRVKYGLKYFPFLAIFTVIIFFAGRLVLPMLGLF